MNPESSSEEHVYPPRIDIARLALICQELGSQIAALENLAPLADRKKVERVLQRSVTQLESALESVTNLAEQHMRRQRASVCKRFGTRGLRVNLASGAQVLDGWVNVDLFHGDIKQCLQWSLPFAKGAVDFMYFSHALEHFRYPDESDWLLAEIRRVMSDDGVLRVVVPDTQRLIRAYTAQDDEFFAIRRTIWPEEAANRTPLGQLLSYSGASAPAHGFHCHKWGYDYATLAAQVKHAGFTRVEKNAYMQSSFEELRVDDSSAMASLFPELEMSLFVEARP